MKTPILPARRLATRQGRFQKFERMSGRTAFGRTGGVASHVVVGLGVVFALLGGVTSRLPPLPGGSERAPWGCGSFRNSS